MERKDNSISAKTQKGMSLTVDDQKWIKVVLDRQNDSWNDAFDTNIKQLTAALAEVIQESNDRMSNILEKHGSLIERIQIDIKEIKQGTECLRREIANISVEIENLTNRIKDHDIRLLTIEGRLGILKEK